MTEEASIETRSLADAAWTRPIRRVRSLRFRAMAIVVLVAVSPLFVILGVSAFENNLEPRLQRNVLAAAQIALKTLDESPTSPDEKIGRLAFRHGVRIRIVDADRVVFDRNEDLPRGLIGLISAASFGPDGAPSLARFDETLPPLPTRPEVLHAKDQAHAACFASTGQKLMVCTATARTQTGKVVVVQESTRRAVRALYDLRYQMVKLVLMVLPFACLLAWWLGWRMVRPLEILRDQVMTKVTRLDTGADLEMKRNDEFGDLAAAFNTLLSRLRERDRANERALQDLVHEAKTPVASIRAAAESLGSGRPIDADRARRLANVLDGASTRLNVVVTEVLELARAEGGLRGENRAPTDLAALVRGIVTHAENDERYQEITFAITSPAQLELVCVAERVETAVRNLIDNAASFAGEGGGNVKVRLADDDDTVCLEIEDDGPGLTEENRARVFDRFYTNRKKGGGTGIGLALVRAVVEAHHGETDVISTPGAGACFRMRLARVAPVHTGFTSAE